MFADGRDGAHRRGAHCIVGSSAPITPASQCQAVAARTRQRDEGNPQLFGLILAHRLPDERAAPQGTLDAVLARPQAVARCSGLSSAGGHRRIWRRVAELPSDDVIHAAYGWLTIAD